MTFNEYVELSDSTDTRIVLYPNGNIAANVLSHHKGVGALVLSLRDCVDKSVVSLPMPNLVMNSVFEFAKNNNARIVIVGIDAYLTLVSDTNKNAFFTALYGVIDKNELNVVFLMSDNNNIASHFANPKYQNSLQIIYIDGEKITAPSPTITLAPSRWFSDTKKQISNFHDLIKALGDFLPTGDVMVALSGYSSKQAGLSIDVNQILSIKEFMTRFHGISVNLSDTSLEKLLSSSIVKKMSPKDYLSSEFGEANIEPRLALKKLLELSANDLWPAFAWFVGENIAYISYLKRVLTDGTKRETLLRQYIVVSALASLNDNNSTAFAAERAAAVKEIGDIAKPLIGEFVSATKENTSAEVVRFLNCGTEIEAEEIVRRVSSADLTVRLPKIFAETYPLLADYFSNDYDYCDRDLTTYFNDYRKLKIKNTITQEFAQRACDLIVPSTVVTRDSILQDLSKDDNIALLVVDGMGAEYYPLLLAMANRRGMNIVSHAIASVKLPTSTEFNPIMWAEERCLKPEIKAIDDIAHDGAVKYEVSSFERNIVSVLNVFANNVFSRIMDGLSRFARVVVTADHGASRLAVLAHNKNIGTTLPLGSNVLDWRFTIATPNVNRPPELESVYNAKENQTYWVVRGYNRLSKKGSKPNELHGGASIEERLVPVIVFSKEKTTAVTKLLGKKTLEQLVEKTDFDI
ncbi:MAG: Uncharacterized protein XD84_2093 [Desulfotomaculum sp. 46_80]|nr:MAG: Uncharacterized protein XD84_2093 [Desulfotomaculum sp. 46_80]